MHLKPLSATDRQSRSIWLCANLARAQAPAPGNLQTPPLTQLTVENRKDLTRRVEHYVLAVTGATPWDDPIQRWRAPLCPVVAGLPHEQGVFVFNRFTDTVTSLGVSVGKEGCHPNFAILVTPAPDAFLAEAVRRYPNAFGEGAGVASSQSKSRPVRIWYNAVLGAAGGETAMPAPGTYAPTFTIHPVAPRFEYSVARKLVAVVAVVDASRIAGLDWRQVTDYIAMAGLTRTNLDADFGDAPTILRLFGATAAGLSGMSDWDRDFMRDLYTTPQEARSQRNRIDARLVRDLEPVAAQ